MVYIKAKDPVEGVQYLARALRGALSGDSMVLWLVSGGSNIAAAVQVRQSLPTNRLKNLKIGLVDERYGNYGYKDSNYTQLQQAGFDFNNIDFVPVLTTENLSLEQTTNNYQEQIEPLFKRSAIIIGQFGIGTDGHTAGILPGSEATAANERLVIGYKETDFSRITLSFRAIKMVNEAYVFAYGENKRATLSLLHDKDLPLNDQPAQIFRQSIPKSFIINNMIGDSE